MKRLLAIAALCAPMFAQQMMTINGVPNQVVVLPTPTASALGGVQSIANASNQWVSYIGTDGVPHQSQPSFTSLNGSAACSQLPAMTGDATTSAGSCAHTVAKINGTSVPTNSAADQVLLTTGAAAGSWASLSNCGDSTHAISYNTTTHAFGCQSITGSAAAGGTTGQVQYNNSGALGGFTMGGDATLNTGTGALSIAKIGGQTASLGGALTTGGAFTTSGAYGVTLTATGTTSVTLPTAGTLAILGLNTFTKTQTFAANTVASGATPAFDLSLGNTQYMSALAINASPTVSNITAGGKYTFVICNNGTGGYTWTWPASVHGGLTIGTTAGKCSVQTFESPDGSTLYAVGTGAINI